jgi:hypothetical protein
MLRYAVLLLLLLSRHCLLMMSRKNNKAGEVTVTEVEITYCVTKAANAMMPLCFQQLTTVLTMQLFRW